MSQAVALAASPDDGPNWPFIQSLYLQGLTPKQISAQTGVKADTISCRASRNGWTSALAKAKPAVQVTVETSKAKDSEASLSKSSEAVRSGLADVITRSVEKIQALTLKTPKHALKVNSELECVVRNAKTVFGWSEGQSHPAVRINILGSAVIDTQPKAIEPAAPVPE